jgi:PAS domain-containing protein
MVLSGYTELQSIIDAINEGAIYKFLTKPWDDVLLRGHVAEAFRQKEMADENRRLARQVEAANADYLMLNQRLEALLAQQRGEAELFALVASSARDALEALPGAVVVVDGDGTLAFVNAEARELIPGAAAELGAPAVEVLPDCLTWTEWGAGGAEAVVELGGRRHRALRRTLQRDGQMPSHLLLLTPEIAVEDH